MDVSLMTVQRIRNVGSQSCPLCATETASMGSSNHQYCTTGTNSHRQAGKVVNGYKGYPA